MKKPHPMHVWCDICRTRIGKINAFGECLCPDCATEPNVMGCGKPDPSPDDNLGWEAEQLINWRIRHPL